MSFGLHLAPETPRMVHELKLHTIRIAEEDCIVAFAVLRIFRGSVEHLDLFPFEETMERVEICARPRDIVHRQIDMLDAQNFDWHDRSSSAVLLLFEKVSRAIQRGD